MIDFLLSIEEHKEEYDSRQAWKIRYPLSTISVSGFRLSVGRG
ncbi:IS1548 transposase [Streptococcus suis]|uniref:IS1548 transposase n=1 Tax=Streptococcus suis TaxID=1307 RepID=A0A116P0T8_STRSU|nr:IS1548 transposase [Streptococcus suis]